MISWRHSLPEMDPPERPEGHDPVGSGIESFQLWRISGESCPEGMIPIRRTTEKRTYPDARHFATSAETPQFSNNNRTPACAHASNVEERNAQCRHISHSFMSKKSPYARPSHITVCLEDLNYRMQGIDTLPARSLIQRNLLKSLFHQKRCWNRIDTFARSPIKDFSVIRTFKCTGEGTRSLGSC
ncbi:hypothetical protein MRB53_032824 [Persea americana]|uniref:Uncharacterized protein n=1 Tax=Persea americana TaxID=3435 RepID=A0ACC2KSW0_PERAE|nr:hypothetical protein MRB53_032824 [Persea americana]